MADYENYSNRTVNYRRHSNFSCKLPLAYLFFMSERKFDGFFCYATVCMML